MSLILLLRMEWLQVGWQYIVNWCKILISGNFTCLIDFAPHRGCGDKRIYRSLVRQVWRVNCWGNFAPASPIEKWYIIELAMYGYGGPVPSPPSGRKGGCRTAVYGPSNMAFLCCLGWSFIPGWIIPCNFAVHFGLIIIKAPFNSVWTSFQAAGSVCATCLAVF